MKTYRILLPPVMMPLAGNVGFTGSD